MLLGNQPIGTVAYLGGVPAVMEEFAWSWSQMVQFNTEYMCSPGQYVHYDRARVSYHAYARNSLAERMRGDWLLMLDCDHAFDPDIVLRMLDRMIHYNVRVLTGVYTYKNPPHAPLLFREGKDGLFENIGAWDEDATLLPCDSAGGGCLMVRRDVFEEIRSELKCGPFDIDPPFSEDHSFFKRCKKLGIQPYFDPRIECHHLTVKRLGLSDFNRDDVSIGDRINVQGVA